MSITENADAIFHSALLNEEMPPMIDMSNTGRLCEGLHPEQHQLRTGRELRHVDRRDGTGPEASHPVDHVPG
ncbi:MAG: hypothetical protein KDB88_03765, partial [Flavobacteriales bacterium]|nr:hypothetical protein [Flavobacteriales bacterium]